MIFFSFRSLLILVKLQILLFKPMLNYMPDNPFTRNYLLPPQPKLYTSHANNNYTRKQTQILHYSRTEHYPLNIWNFRDDHNSRFMPYTPIRSYQEITSFEKSMMTSAATPRRELGNSRLKYSLVEDNPFHRKNLLISKEDIQEYIQQDLNKINYKYYVPETSNYGSNKDDTYMYESKKYDNYKPPSYRNIEGNGSIMMNLMDKKHNREYDRQNQMRLQQRESPSGRQDLQQKLRLDGQAKRVSDKPKQSYESHKTYKQEITVKGQRFYKAKVFPVNP